MESFTDRVAVGHRGRGAGSAPRSPPGSPPAGRRSPSSTSTRTPLRRAARPSLGRRPGPRDWASTIADEDAVEAAVARVAEEFGRIDILVNNAGVTRDKHALQDERRGLGHRPRRTPCAGNFLMSRAVQKHMVERRYGRIGSLSSRSALGNRGQANYSAAKAGVIGLTATLAIELGPFGSRSTAVAPGYIDTDMTRATAAGWAPTRRSSRPRPRPRSRPPGR